MRSRVMFRFVTIAVLAAAAFAPTGSSVGQGIFHRDRNAADEPNQNITVDRLAAIIDDLDKELFEEGMIGIKAPDVWGQNRMTKYRAEYEKEMADQVNKFAVTLNAAIRRADTAVFTTATSIGAAIQPRPARGRAGAASSATAEPTTNTVVIPASPGSTAQPLLDSIGELLAKNAENIPQLPTTLLPGDAIALEPKIGLDERDDYLKHLQELRRTNTGDDLTDAPGYGLYLVRMPIALLPGPEVRKGHGATVTVEAKHVLTPDLLPNTFRDVAIMDAAYQINPILLKLVHDVPLDIRNVTDATGGSLFRRQMPMMASGAPENAASGGGTAAVVSSIPLSESPEIYGEDELKLLSTAIKFDLADTYRHDPSILSWVINELGSAHRFMREQSRNGVLADLFAADKFQQLDFLLQQRDYLHLAQWRKGFLGELVIRRNGFAPGGPNDPTFIQQHIRATDVFVYALMVQSVLVDRQLKHDMDVVSQQKGCPCADLETLIFYELFPTPEAREAFNAYVACKWPIHVFAIDPAVEQQNQLDLFSARSEFQAALAIGVASGNINLDQATKFARRLETDIETIGLNRTAIGYGAGESTFGWQFYPRIQSPPTPGNVRRIAGLIGGTSYNQNYLNKNRFIEPGPRECVALIVTPNFVPAIHFTSFGNWFEYTGKHADRKFNTRDILEFSRKLQAAKTALDHVCDSGEYRPGEVSRLADRIAQLEAKLPSQDYRVPLPYEGDLTGSEIFSSSGARLFPRLLSWFGEPAEIGKPSTVFLLGTSFSVHETQVIAGGVPALNMKLISRNVMEITIAADARAVSTNDGRHVFDVHVATPNGISNHLFVEANPSSAAQAATAAPALGYALKTAALNISYQVNGRVEGDPSQPGSVEILGTDPGKVVIGWLDPVGLAPQVVDVTFRFPNLSAITLHRINPTNTGQIVIQGADLNELTEGIMERLRATAVTFDPVRNPTPLSPITTSKITVTPRTGTHAEQDVDASGKLTVSFTPIASPGEKLVPGRESPLVPRSRPKTDVPPPPLAPTENTAPPTEGAPQPPGPTDIPPAPDPDDEPAPPTARRTSTPRPRNTAAPTRSAALTWREVTKGLQTPTATAPGTPLAPIADRSFTPKHDPAVSRTSAIGQIRPTRHISRKMP